MLKNAILEDVPQQTMDSSKLKSKNLIGYLEGIFYNYIPDHVGIVTLSISIVIMIVFLRGFRPIVYDQKILINWTLQENLIFEFHHGG